MRKFLFTICWIVWIFKASFFFSAQVVIIASYSVDVWLIYWNKCSTEIVRVFWVCCVNRPWIVYQFQYFSWDSFFGCCLHVSHCIYREWKSNRELREMYYSAVEKAIFWRIHIHTSHNLIKYISLVDAEAQDISNKERFVCFSRKFNFKSVYLNLCCSANITEFFFGCCLNFLRNLLFRWFVCLCTTYNLPLEIVFQWMPFIFIFLFGVFFSSLFQAK